MKEIAKLKQLPPVYTGKWATATDEEVEEELAKGTPYTYRFRVPKEGSLKINDLIRGEVSYILWTCIVMMVLLLITIKIWLWVFYALMFFFLIDLT